MTDNINEKYTIELHNARMESLCDHIRAMCPTPYDSSFFENAKKNVVSDTSFLGLGKDGNNNYLDDDIFCIDLAIVSLLRVTCSGTFGTALSFKSSDGSYDSCHHDQFQRFRTLQRFLKENDNKPIFYSSHVVDFSETSMSRNSGNNIPHIGHVKFGHLYPTFPFFDVEMFYNSKDNHLFKFGISLHSENPIRQISSPNRGGYAQPKPLEDYLKFFGTLPRVVPFADSLKLSHTNGEILHVHTQDVSYLFNPTSGYADRLESYDKNIKTSVIEGEPSKHLFEVLSDSTHVAQHLGTVKEFDSTVFYAAVNSIILPLFEKTGDASLLSHEIIDIRRENLVRKEIKTFTMEDLVDRHDYLLVRDDHDRYRHSVQTGVYHQNHVAGFGGRMRYVMSLSDLQHMFGKEQKKHDEEEKIKLQRIDSEVQKLRNLLSEHQSKINKKCVTINRRFVK